MFSKWFKIIYLLIVTYHICHLKCVHRFGQSMGFVQLWVHGNTVCYSLLLSSVCDLCRDLESVKYSAPPMHVGFWLVSASAVWFVLPCVLLQSYSTLCNPMIYSSSGSSVWRNSRQEYSIAWPFLLQVLPGLNKYCGHFCLPSDALISSPKKHMPWIPAGPRMRPMENTEPLHSPADPHPESELPGGPIGLWANESNII